MSRNGSVPHYLLSNCYFLCLISKCYHCAFSLVSHLSSGTEDCFLPICLALISGSLRAFTTQTTFLHSCCNRYHQHWSQASSDCSSHVCPCVCTSSRYLSHHSLKQGCGLTGNLCGGGCCASCTSLGMGAAGIVAQEHYSLIKGHDESDAGCDFLVLSDDS